MYVLLEVSQIGWSSLRAETVIGCDGLSGVHICGHICFAWFYYWIIDPTPLKQADPVFRNCQESRAGILTTRNPHQRLAYGLCVIWYDTY